LACLEFSPEADQDLDEIHAYIAADSRGRAQVFIERVKARCDRLKEHPLMGRVRPEILLEIRSIPVKPVVIFYRYFKAEDLIEITRVIDGRRDLHTIFSEDV
jgi:toxin ParE1/3/4